MSEFIDLSLQMPGNSVKCEENLSSVCNNENNNSDYLKFMVYLTLKRLLYKHITNYVVSRSRATCASHVPVTIRVLSRKTNFHSDLLSRQEQIDAHLGCV